MNIFVSLYKVRWIAQFLDIIYCKYFSCQVNDSLLRIGVVHELKIVFDARRGWKVLPPPPIFR